MYVRGVLGSLCDYWRTRSKFPRSQSKKLCSLSGATSKSGRSRFADYNKSYVFNHKFARMGDYAAFDYRSKLIPKELNALCAATSCSDMVDESFKKVEWIIMFCLFGGIGVIRMKQYEAKCHEAKEKQKIWPTLLRMTWDIQVDRWSGPSPRSTSPESIQWDG